MRISSQIKPCFWIMAMALLSIQTISVVQAQTPEFTLLDMNGVVNPRVRWAPGMSNPWLYQGGYYKPELGKPDYWRVNGTRITVSFPNTPDPSVIGTGNWIIAGMYLTGFDLIHSSPLSVDWGYYTCLVLDYQGNLYLDAGIYRLEEFPGTQTSICERVWLIGGVPYSTPITLCTYWVNSRYVDWYVIIDGDTYNPPESIFDMINEDKPDPAFVVGTCDLTHFWFNGPYYKCFYFQFGIQSPYPAEQSGWTARLVEPSYDDVSGLRIARRAISMGGRYGFLDTSFRWGGADHPGIGASSWQYGVDFSWTGYRIPDFQYLWTPNPPGGGGCPFVSVWDGTGYVLDNNILPTSAVYHESDVQDYYRLEQALTSSNGKYSLVLSEFEMEHSYIDQVKLLAVDHDKDVNIALAPSGEILTYQKPLPPQSAFDNHENSRLKEIKRMDGDISNPSTYFYGDVGDYLTLNFGRVNSGQAKLILRDDMKCPNTCIMVQVKDNQGGWQNVVELVPRDYWSIEAVDLSSFVEKRQDFWVRLLWTSPHRVDFVGLDTTAQADFQLQTATLVSAIHSIRGDVGALLLTSDNNYAELIPGDQIELQFILAKNSRETRTFILYSEGYYYTMP